jgi:dTDP-4-amino-4,6-dideoxygalactose transaminase
MIPVHMAGHPCQIQEILDLAQTHDLFVVEDAAHAFGAGIEGRKVGSLGDVTVFSFYATKCITTGDGGLLTTAAEDLAKELRLMSYHGMDGDAWQRYSDKGRWFYEVVRLGYKMHLGDPAAALGLVQLGRAEEFQARRTDIADLYNQAFAGLPGVTLPPAKIDVTHTWHLYILRVDPKVIRGGRDGLIEDLTAANIGSSVHFIPLHRHPAFAHLLAPYTSGLQVTDRYYATAVSLPLFPAMTDQDVTDVITAVKTSIRGRSR